MEIDVYLNVIRRWIWLILLMTLVAAGLSYYFVRQQPPVYAAQVQLLVGPGIDNANADINVQRASTQVMQTYAQIATTRSVMQQVIDKLRLDIGPSSLAGQIAVTPNIDAQVLNIAVRSGDPKQSVAIANALADVLVNLRYDQVNNSVMDSAGAASVQIKQLQDLATRTQARIGQLESDLNVLNDAKNKPPFTDQENKIKALEAQVAAPIDPALAKQMQDHQTRVTQLETALKTTVNVDARRLTLDELAREDAQLTGLRAQVNEQKRLLLDQLTQERNRLTSMQTALSSQQNQILSQIAIERAQLADAQRSLAAAYPVLQNDLARKLTLIDPAVNAPAESSRANLIILAAGLGGLVLALTLAFAFEYFDDRIRTPEQLAEVTGTKVWGVLGRHKASLGPGWSMTGVTSSDGAIAEAFRRWCMNLMPNGPSNVCSLLVTEMDSGDAAAEVASGIAVTLARFGRSAVLVDANFQRPTLERWFAAANEEGVKEWLGNDNDSRDPKLLPVEWAPGLSVFPASSNNGESSQQLTLPRVKELVERVQEQADMLVIAGPPLASSADSLLLASHTGGVLLVAQRGKTRRKVAQATVENLRSLGIQILGTILADSNRSRMSLPKLRKSSPKKGRKPAPQMDTSERVISFSSRAPSRPSGGRPGGHVEKDHIGT